MQTFIVEQLPEIDRNELRRGRCPWCFGRTYDRTLEGKKGDGCGECGDFFISKAEIGRGE